MLGGTLGRPFPDREFAVRRWFLNTKIRHKLALLLVLVSSVTLLLAGGLFMLNHVLTIRASMVRTLTALGEVVGGNCTAAIDFQRPDDAADVLASLRQEPLVSAACIYDRTGKVFATYRRAGSGGFSPPPSRSGRYFHGPYLDVYRPITEQGERLGTVLIRGRTDEIRRQVARSLNIGGWVLAVSIIGAVLLSVMLQRLISDPIRRLADVANQVSKTDDYSLRVPRDTDDEIGMLCDGFNNMLAQIQERDRELNRHRLHLEELVAERTQDLERKTAEAMSASVAKSQFLATISHEIRTPMNGVMGMTSLLLDTDLTPEQQDFAETIRQSTESLLTIINDILDFSKIEAGRLELERQPFDLQECLDSALDLVAADAAERELELGCVVGEGCPTRLVGDVTRVRQVLVNLLSNACKFTDRGEVVVSVSARPLLEESPPRDGVYEFHVSVRDTGIGIPADRMDRLFQSFTQIDASTTRRYGGTGLGLAISKRLCELMEGTMWAESRQGRGSTFHFTFRAEVEDGAVAAASASEQGELRGRKVLIVDDSRTNRRVLEHQTRAWGMEPLLCLSSAEALSRVERGERFDLALLDFQLPGMDGITLAREMRSRGVDPKVPLVLLTSLAHRQAETDREPFAAVLTKPLRPGQLFRTLTALFGKRKPPAPEQGPPPRLDPDLARKHPLRILLAEDNPTNQKLVLQLLNRMGYTADLAANGVEVLESLRRQPYDVVLMDVQMPRMDGLEASRIICREWPADQRPRLIAMTAGVLPEDREACRAAGLEDYLSKPLVVAELIQVLSAATRLVREPQPSVRRDPEPPAPPLSEPGDAPESPAGRRCRMRQALLAAAGDDRAFLRDFIETFLGDGKVLLAQLNRAVASRAAADLERAAHTLKSNAAEFDATRLAELSRRLELLGRSGDLTEAAPLLEKVRRQYEQVRQTLETLRDELT